MKVQILKAIFLSPKNNKKADKLCMKFSSTSNASFKMNATIFCCSFFFEEWLYPLVRINKTVNEHTVNYHPSPSELTSTIHPLIFPWTPKGYISPAYFLNCFSRNYIYPTMFAEKFQIHGVKITEKYICESKNSICSFLILHPPRPKKKKSPPGFYHYHSRQKEIIHFPQTTFFENLFFPSRKGGGLWSWKINQS